MSSSASLERGFICLIVKQTLNRKRSSAQNRCMLRNTKELILEVKSQTIALRESDIGFCGSHKTNACMKTSWSRMTADCEWSHCTRRPFTMYTNTSTHSDVQTHIPQVGSWSEVSKCEICQPMGDWVIEEFDSERNILLPWWWTRKKRYHVQREEGLVGNTEIGH